MKHSEARQGRPDRRIINDEVHHKLRWALITGEIKPGQAMSIRGLAKSLGVGTMPVRDSLKRLVAERGLEMLPNRRLRVPILTQARLSGLFDMRCSLEGLATEHATLLLTDYQLERLEAICREMDDSIASNDVDKCLEGNYAFHFTIYHAQENTDLFSVIERLWLQTGPALREEFMDFGLVAGLNAFHKEILAALQARDAKSARAAIEEDILWAVKYFVRGDRAEENDPTEVGAS